MEYKGHKYKTKFKITAMSCFGPHYGDLYFDSTLVSYKIESIPFDDTTELYKHILTRKFKDKVDGSS